MTLKPAGHRFFCVLLAASLSACAPLASKNDVEESSALPAVTEQAAPPQPMLPPQDLTQELLYAYLIAEMAVHRQQYPVAAKAKWGHKRDAEDLITAKLPALHFYQLAMPAPKAARVPAIKASSGTVSDICFMARSLLDIVVSAL